MVEASDQILRHIEAQRTQLSQHVGELEEKVRETVDWRVHMRERPALFIAGGVVLGLVAWKLIK